MKPTFIVLLFLSFISLQAQQRLNKTVQTQPGTLDQSFGNGGIVYNIASRTFTTTSAIQSDGKLIVGGSVYSDSITLFSLLRYNNDGTLDSSFGIKGIANVEINANQGPVEGWTSVQVQPDGKIVAAGYLLKPDDYPTYPPWNADIVLARFNPDGTPDASFGNKGVVITDFGEYESCNAMTLQPDGKIVLTGIYSLRGTGYDTNILTVRYNQDGSLDAGFGGKGYVIYATPGTGADNGNAIAVQKDGKIVIAGDRSANARCILIRYLPNGDLDNSFGSNGTALAQVGGTVFPEQSFYTITIDKEQRIIAAGLATDDFYNELMSVARFNSNGTPDNSFGEGGQHIITVEENNHLYIAKSVLLLKDERILLAGNAYGNINLVCLQPSGAFDSTFGANGVTITDFGGDESYENTVLQPDGKIVVLGSNGTPFLARYNGYDPGKQPLTVRIKRWLLHHGISWQVQPTKDVRYYAIQRSADGIVYKEIAKLSNKIQVSNYEDATITGGSYYRLAAIGWDGSRTYSNTVLIDESTNVKVFPNPVRDNLQLQGLSEGKTSVSIVDLQGNVRSSSVAGGATYSVNTSQLTPGNYLLKLQHNSTTTTQPFVKE